MSQCGLHHNTGGYDSENTLQTVESLTKTLGTNFIDIILIDEPNEDQLKEALAPRGALESLIKMKEARIINHIGISCRNNGHLKTFMNATPECDVILTSESH